MSESSTPFDWVIDERLSWPPRVRPAAPYGASLLEIMRECPLRACFERSPGYERRMGFAARVGSAFHLTLQFLNEHPPTGKTPVEVIEQARQRLLYELSKQEMEIAKRPREQRLPRDELRVERALDAVIAEALRISEEGIAAHSGWHSTNEVGPTTLQQELANMTGNAALQVEVPVKSKDEVFQGRLDRVEQTDADVILIDYKSALRDDVPERYERQLQLYAWLWFETFGKWPTKAQVLYPFKGTAHSVTIEQSVCLRVVDDYRQVVNNIQQETLVERLARPGDVCQVCEFRPWCRAFWNWQSSEGSYKAALERARFGFEGNIIEIKIVDHHWLLRLRWRNNKIKIVAPQERFPQLKQVEVGAHLRLVDMDLTGLMMEPQARVSSISEIFVIR